MSVRHARGALLSQGSVEPPAPWSWGSAKDLAVGTATRIVPDRTGNGRVWGHKAATTHGPGVAMSLTVVANAIGSGPAIQAPSSSGWRLGTGLEGTGIGYTGPFSLAFVAAPDGNTAMLAHNQRSAGTAWQMYGNGDIKLGGLATKSSPNAFAGASAPRIAVFRGHIPPTGTWPHSYRVQGVERNIGTQNSGADLPAYDVVVSSALTAANRIGEALLYRHYLTDDEVLQAEQYLASEWPGVL